MLQRIDTEVNKQVSVVTGGSGFIGRALVGQLLAIGQRVRVIDSSLEGSRVTSSSPVEYYAVDVRDTAAITKILVGADTCFHLAAVIPTCATQTDLAEMHSINVDGTESVLAASVAAGTSKLVLASSAAVYGECANAATEFQTLTPVSPYGPGQSRLA